MEYKVSSETDASKPVETVPQAAVQSPTVDDLTKRLAALTNAGVQEYADGVLHILFKRDRGSQRAAEDPVTRALREYDEQLLGGNGG